MNGTILVLRALPTIQTIYAWQYKIRLSGVSLPLKSVITHYGTWVNAAIFYAKHLDVIKEIILDIRDNSQYLVQSQAVPQKRSNS